MSLILAVSTSGASVSVALIKDGSLLGEKSLQGASYSATLMPMIDDVMHSFGAKSKDITAFAADTGPGSFTGVRIGICTVNGMANATGVPVIGISSLLALRYLRQNTRFVASLIDARNSNVYAAVYDENTELFSPCALSVDEFCKRVNELPADSVLCVGDGATVNSERIIAECPKVVISGSSIDLPNAQCIGLAAYDCLSNPDSPLMPFALPTYLKLSQAELLMRKQTPPAETGNTND